MNVKNPNNPTVTCPDCGLVYVDDTDWSGDAHSERCCKEEWKRRALEAEKKLKELLDLVG